MSFFARIKGCQVTDATATGKLVGVSIARVALWLRTGMAPKAKARQRAERSVRRGVFSGERQIPGGLDSTSGPVAFPGMDPSVGALGQGRRMESLFGTHMPSPSPKQDDTPKHRQLAYASLVQVGMPAVSVIERHLSTQEAAITLKTELLAVVEEIRAVEDSPDGS